MSEVRGCAACITFNPAIYTPKLGPWVEAISLLSTASDLRSSCTLS